jgi:hypothetical protein
MRALRALYLYGAAAVILVGIAIDVTRRLEPKP